MSTTTANLGLTLPTPNVDSGWGSTLNGDFTLIDNLFTADGSGTSVGLQVGSGKTLNAGGTIVAGGTLILGSGDGTATVTAPTIRGAARTGTNAAGSNLVIDAINGTGTGGSGSIIFRTAPAGSSGSVANTMATVLEVKNTGVVEVKGVDISTYAPTGSVISFAGSSAPTGWLLCYGQSLNTTTYAALFAVLGYTYGGSGANFSLPDLRGRAVAGKDNMGGSTAGRITAAVSGITGTTLGAGGGAEGVTLSTSQIPAHQHFTIAPFEGNGSDISSTTYTGFYADRGNAYSYRLEASTSAATLGLTSSVGGGASHTNTQPTLILNYIIKT